MNKNFAGQTFNNQSFRGQDLTGADFSHCVLNSCDFQGADLTDARFCAAQMGVSLRWKMAKELLSVLYGVVAGWLNFMLAVLLVGFVTEVQKNFLSTDLPNDQLAFIVALLYVFGLCYFVYCSVKYRSWWFVVGYIVGTLIIAVAGVGVRALAGVVGWLEG